MLIACSKCGAANDEHAQECFVCGATNAFEEEAIERETPVAAAGEEASSVASEPEPTVAKVRARPRAPRKPRVKTPVAIPAPVEAFAPATEAVSAEPEPVAATAAAAMSAVEASAEIADEPVAVEMAAEDSLSGITAETAEEEPSLELENVFAASEEDASEDEELAEVIGFAPPVAALAAQAAEKDEMDELRDMDEDLEEEIAAPPAAVAVTDGSSALNPSPRVKEMPRPAHVRPEPEPEWRREVARRLENYRAKRSRGARAAEATAQSPLPFETTAIPVEDRHAEFRGELRRPIYGVQPVLQEVAEAEMTASPAPMAITLEETVELTQVDAPERRIETEPIEITVPQPQFDFVLLDDDDVHPQSALIPVEDLRERGRAALLDVFFLAVTYGGFLALFRAFGGQLSFGKQEAIVYLLTAFLFYTVYFSMFTICGGVTPGMYFRGLTAVSFDGRAPETGQLLRRAFGYAVSGGTLLLGFLWALWDEDRLTWHDRMSQTYVTRSASPMWNDLSDDPANLPDGGNNDISQAM